MKIGVCLPQLGPAAETATIGFFARAADGVDVDSLWAEEHLFRPLDPVTGFGGVDGAGWPEKHSMSLSPLVLLAFVAAQTTNCRIGTSIVVAGYHDPLILAKEAATIDVLSSGRMTLGLGVGWCQDEYDLVGRSFATRGAFADEALAAIRACWGPNPVSFSGDFVTIPLSETSPKPVRGHLPIHGGFMTRAGRRRVARWCDSWQPFGLEAREASENIMAINREAWDDYGRKPLTVALRVLIAPGASNDIAGPMKRSTGVWGGSYERIADRLAEARALGIDEVIMDANFAPRSDETEFWEELAAELPALVSAAHG